MKMTTVQHGAKGCKEVRWESSMSSTVSKPRKYSNKVNKFDEKIEKKYYR